MKHHPVTIQARPISFFMRVLIDHHTRKKLVMSILSLVFLGILGYVMLVGTTTVAISERIQYERDLVVLQSQIGEHEAKILTLQSGIDGTYAQNQGFVPSDYISYIQSEVTTTFALSR